MTTTEIEDQASRKPSGRLRLAARMLFWLLLLVGLYAMLSPNFTNDYKSGKRMQSAALLNTLAYASQTYRTTYDAWPTFQSAPSPAGDFVLRLKTHGAQFVDLMSGNVTEATKALNPRGEAFLVFGDNQLSPDGRHIVDAYGNDDLVLIFDSDGDGQIAPFTVPMTAKNGRAVTVRQARPVPQKVIALSPGDGKSGESVISTWEISR